MATDAERVRDALDHLNNALQIAGGLLSEEPAEIPTWGDMREGLEGIRSRLELAKLALQPHQGSRKV